ncbi:hypothetical protein P5V15_010369 [Pogonomyrmex californicus]
MFRPCKKKRDLAESVCSVQRVCIPCRECVFRAESVILVERRAVRLLSRRYTLTAGYKYLEIGINVGPPSYVEIALGDHRGQELILSLEMWKDSTSSDGIFINCC